MLTIMLTRHGATPRSDPEQHLGQRIDIALSDAGRAGAEALADRLAGVAFGRIVSSPLRRALETARIVAGGQAVETDARLAEIDYGAWEGLTYEQIDERDALFRRRWEADPASLACPEGESGDEVAERIRSFLAEALAGPATAPAGAPVSGHEMPRILVIAHSTVNRILLCLALGVPARDFRRRFRQDPANLTVLRFPGRLEEGAQLIVANDTSHLDDGGMAAWR